MGERGIAWEIYRGALAARVCSVLHWKVGTEMMIILQTLTAHVKHFRANVCVLPEIFIHFEPPFECLVRIKWSETQKEPTY